MKIKLDSKLYAVLNVKDGTLVPRYTGGFFWTRKGDAEAKFHQVKRNGEYELLTCSIKIEDSMSSAEYNRQEAEKKARELDRQRKANEFGNWKSTKLRDLDDKLFELTATRNIEAVKGLLEKHLLVPAYKEQIEDIIKEIETTKNAKFTYTP
jgi:alpha-galactosidase/6-phospho-beta-glucosidase family protein